MSGTNKTLSNEDHPNWYHDIPLMHTLILGSYPPHSDKWDYEFYYPNKQNHFWKILSALENGSLPQHNQGEEAVAERKQIMEKLKTGVQNLGLKIERLGKSASDKDISIKEYQDIISIITRHPELNTIILPGYSDPASTYRSFINYLDLNSIAHTLPAQVKALETFTIHTGSRNIKCVLAWSTSTATFKSLPAMVEHFNTVFELCDR